MSEAPSLMTRVRARLSGEVPAGSLDAYRAAGADAYGLYVAVEQARAEGAVADGPFRACAWNAFVLQTLGDAFVDADYRADPGTVGFLPPVTADQALSCYGQVEQWLVRARRAEHDPRYRLDVHLPADLPGWVEVEPCPEPHLHAMLDAGEKLVEHARLAVADLDRGEDVTAARRERIAGLLSAAETTAAYARQLHARFHAGSGDAVLHERIERSIKEALAYAYLVGQLAARPELADAVPDAPARLPGPGEPGFDPWCLTDPETREHWQRDPQASRAIDTLWALDPDPEGTLAIQAEINAALERGDIGYATGRNGRRLGCYFCCPWAPVYEARRSVTIGGRRLRTLQQFTFDVSAEELAEGGPFKRELLLSDFRKTDAVDYCDPTAGGHAD